MQEKGVREPFRSQDIVALLGAYDLNILHEAGRSIFAIQKIEIHPDWLYQSVQYDADIAVLVLIGEVQFTPYIQPVCLIKTRRIAEITNGVAVGYGKSEDRSKYHENIPKVIDTPIYTNQQCFQSNQNLAIISSGRTFCGGLGKGVGVCKGDSGGGVFVTAGNVYYLRGIVSSSLRDANHECDVDNYSVFTNVLKFNDWIEGIRTQI
jgi:secreted trypsin-like serine protease